MPILSLVNFCSLARQGRGFRGETDADEPDRNVGRYEALATGDGPGPQKCELDFATAAMLRSRASCRPEKQCTTCMTVCVAGAMSAAPRAKGHKFTAYRA